VPFDTPHDAALAVRGCARSVGVDLFLLPYQPLNNEAPWWLSPRSENPGYRYGKAIFTKDLLRPERLFVGLYMGKGIGAAGAPMYTGSAKGRRYIMDGPGRLGEAWTWPRFLDSLVGGAFDPIASTAEAAAGKPLVIAVDAAYVPVPSPGDADVHSLTFPRDIVVFQFSGGALTPLDARFDADRLRGLEGATTLRELGERIQGLSDLERMWIDFGAGMRFRTGQGSSTRRNADLCDAPALWACAVEPWTPWIR
jgi:hypothetical protein